MQRNLWFILILSILSSCSNPTPTETSKVNEPKIIAKYLSTSAYPAKKMTADKKGFVLGEKMKDGKGKYTFSFYNDSIILKTDRTTNFIINEVDKRYYPNNVGYFVKNSKGERHLITVSKISGNDETHIDFYEDFRNGIFNNLTKIICQDAIEIHSKVEEKKNGL